MLIEVFKSKIHRVTVTASDLNYIGSITVDEDLIDAAGLVVGERVYIVNVNNGERFDTYVIKGSLARVRKFQMKIYDRWGNSIVELKDKNTSWNATVNGKKITNGTYNYFLYLEMDNGELIKKIGKFEVL